MSLEPVAAAAIAILAPYLAETGKSVREKARREHGKQN
jgi:hypothetical protein